MSNVAIDLTKTVKEIITTMKTAIDNLKTQILEAVYPVGSVYVSLTNSSNPADILGFGTWEALPAGYGLVAQGTATAEDGSTLTFTAGQKSGEFKHQLTVGELAGHKHSITFDSKGIGAKGGTDWYYDIGESGTYEKSRTPTNITGNDEYHNNVSPCISVYMWRRIN